MDLSEVSASDKVTEYLLKISDVKNSVKKRVPQVPYTPPHRRGTMNIVFQEKKSADEIPKMKLSKFQSSEEKNEFKKKDEKNNLSTDISKNIQEFQIIDEKLSQTKDPQLMNASCDTNEIVHNIKKEINVDRTIEKIVKKTKEEENYDTMQKRVENVKKGNNDDTIMQKTVENKKEKNNDTTLDQIVETIKKEKNDDTIHKVLELANTYVNVTFKTMLGNLYRKKYCENLPLNILQDLTFLVKVNDELLKHQCVAFTSEKKASEMKYSTPSQVVNTAPKFVNAKHIGKSFLVKIYNCKSCVIGDIKIWGRIIDTKNKQLDKLLEEMMIFYNYEKLIAPCVKEDGLYAVFKDSFWHRVKCLKRDTLDAVVLFIDRGDEFTFPLTQIYELHEKFSLLSKQAVQMRLLDLGIFSDCREILPFLNATLREKTVNATSTKPLNLDENKCWDVQLYLNIYGEQLNISDLVIEELLKTFLNPKFNIRKEEMVDVHVSCINENKLYIQLIQSKSYIYFIKLFQDVLKRMFDNSELKQTEQNLKENKIYLIQNPTSKIWYRSKILRFKNDKEVEAAVIDFGTTTCLTKESFILLEKFSSILAKYPNQAIEVRVSGLSNFYEHHEALEHFQKLIRCSSRFCASFLGNNNNIWTIRLFKKEHDTSLTLIDDTLLFNQKSQIIDINAAPMNKSESSNDMSKMRELQRSLSLKTLSAVLDAPSIPKSFFDGHVILADSPSKFVLQILHSRSELKELDSKLSEFCNSYAGPRFNIMSLKPGELYAAKYDEYDSKWHRVYLVKVSDMANIYFCDYGYYKDVNIQNIVPLEAQFHKLPYQAIWAELYGIKPVFNRWTVDDALRFKDLTQQKNFVCAVRNKKSFQPKNNILVPITVETVYSLELVDTNTEEDVYIANLFVNERRALKSRNCADQD